MTGTKRWLAGLLCAVLLAGLLPMEARAAGGHWADDAVTALNNIYGSGVFQAEDTAMTQGDAYAVLSSMGCKSEKVSESSTAALTRGVACEVLAEVFDLPVGSSSSAIQYLYERNIINGYADGTFLGGAICAGVKTASESLVNTAAKLPRFELVPPKDAIARSTIEGMQSGAVYGYAGQVDYIVRKFRENPLMKDAKVIATGGLSELVVNADKSIIDVVDRSLSLKGLKILYDMNKEGNNE